MATRNPRQSFLRMAVFGMVLATGLSIADQPAMAPTNEADIGVSEVLDRAERSRRVVPEHSELWREGLRHMDQSLAVLELGLLEILGPDQVRDSARGAERLRELLDTAHHEMLPEAQRLLRVIIALAEAEVRTEAARAELDARLQKERRAHLDTLEKLDALRQIERDLDTDASRAMESRGEQ